MFEIGCICLWCHSRHLQHRRPGVCCGFSARHNSSGIQSGSKKRDDGLPECEVSSFSRRRIPSVCCFAFGWRSAYSGESKWGMVAGSTAEVLRRRGPHGQWFCSSQHSFAPEPDANHVRKRLPLRTKRVDHVDLSLFGCIHRAKSGAGGTSTDRLRQCLPIVQPRLNRRLFTALRTAVILCSHVLNGSLFRAKSLV